MSILSSISNFVTNTQTKIKNITDNFISSQTNRLDNSYQVTKSAILSPISKPNIKANTPSPTLNKVLEVGASNPYTTAGIAAGGSSLIKSAATSFSSAGIGTKFLVSGAAIAGTGITAGSQTARTTTLSAIGGITPESIFRTTYQGSTLAQNYKTSSINDLKSYASDNKETLTIAGILAGTYAATKLSGLPSTLSTISNTSAVKENTKTALNSIPTNNLNQYDDVINKQNKTIDELQTKISNLQTETNIQRTNTEVATIEKPITTNPITPTKKKSNKKKSTKKKSTKKKSTKKKSTKKKSTKKKSTKKKHLNTKKKKR